MRLIKIGLGVSIAGLVPILVIFAWSLPSFPGAVAYYAIIPLYYSILTPLFLIFLPIFFGRYLRAKGRKASIPVLASIYSLCALGLVFLVPIIPHTFYNGYCQAYITDWESLGYSLSGKGLHYFNGICL